MAMGCFKADAVFKTLPSTLTDSDVRHPKPSEERHHKDVSQEGLFK